MSINCILVAYLGGSSVTVKNEWVGGFGVHGYLANTEVVSSKGYGIGAFATVTGYKKADQIADPNEKIKVHKFFNTHQPLAKVTDNVAKLSGVIWVLESIVSGLWATTVADTAITSICIKSESKYVIDGISKHIKTWEDNGWVMANGTEPANVETWKQVASLLKRVTIPVNFILDDENIGDVGIEAANFLAHCGKVCCIAQMKNIPTYIQAIPEVTDDFSLHNQVDMPDLIKDYNRLYFNSRITDLTADETKGVYYLGRISADDEGLTGTRKTDISLAIVRQKSAIGIIESLIESFNNLLKYDDIRICRLNIDAVKGKSMDYVVRNRLCNIGLSDVAPRKAVPFGLQRPHIMYDPYDRIIARDFNPSGTSLNICNYYHALNTVYNVVMNSEPHTDDLEILKVESIVPILYDKETNKKGEYYVIKKELPVGTKEVSFNTVVDGSTLAIQINLGYDCYSRNALARIAEELVDVKIVVYREYMTDVRYLTIIETLSGTAIVSSIFTNRLFL